jgi:hypothetical protein
MKRLAVLLSLLVAALAAGPSFADGVKVKKPQLNLRATPRMSFSPSRILLTAELTGGADVEDYHCPEIEWDWDDGGKSVKESDCTPFEPGVTKIERRFTAEHEYRKAGVYNVRITMRRTTRPIATANVRVTVRPGLGDTTMEN